MELETLEVLLEVNTARIQESIDKVMPNLEGMMSKIEKLTGNSMNRTEKSFDVQKGTTKFAQQVEKMTDTLEKMMSKMEQTTKKSSDSIGANFSTGIKKARPKVSKEVDAMVNEINAKMGQAKAAQEKVAYLKSQRQNSSSKGDTGKTVKYDEQIARAQASMVKYQDQAKNLAQSLKNEFDTVPTSLNNIARAMDSNEAKFNTMRKNVRDLESKYQGQLKPVGSFTKGFKNVDTPESNKTAEKIQIQSDKMQQLASANDQLQKEYAQTQARAESLSKVLGRVNAVIDQSSMATGSAGAGAKSGLGQSDRIKPKRGGVFNRMSNSIAHGGGNIGDGFKKSLGIVSKFGGLFSRTSDKVTQGNRNMAMGNNAFLQSIKYLLPSLIVYQLIGGAISKLAGGLMGALKSNDQFANSLNQIKVNLLTAFYPIYTAILPAINAFMSALATLTGQFASFIANVFGTTYQAAKQGASGLYDNVQAMNDTGSSASKAKEKVDKLQRSLMGFDEINRIGLDNNSDDDSLDNGGVKAPNVDFGKAMGNYNTPEWMKNLQKLLQDFFKPFQDAWKNQGQKVIDAWKYALGEVIGLASSIGKSFMEVWTNGTGQRFIENLLILLADMLNIVGDIAKAFKDAWNDDGRGTALIQSIFDMFNGILELLHSIATAFRDAWNDGTGESIAANLLEIFTNIFNTIGNLANQFKKAWDAGGTGKDIFSAILGIINDVLGHINNITKATSDWAKTLDFTPLLNSIKSLLESIRPLSDKIGDGLEWFYKNVLLPLAKYSIEDLIPAFLDALKGAIDLLSGVIDAFKPAFDFLWNSVLKPLAEWSGGVIVDVLKSLGDVLSTIGGWLSEHAEGFSNFVLALGAFAGTVAGISAVASAISGIVGVISSVSAVIGGAGGVMGVLGSLVAFLGGPVTIAIGAVIAVGVLLWKNWDSIMEAAGKLKDWIGEKWSNITDATSQAWDNIKNWTSEKWTAIKETITGAVDGAKEWVSEKWSDISTGTSEAWDNVKKWTSEKWESVKETVKTKASDAWDNVKTNWESIKEKTSNTWEDIKSKTNSTWDNVSSKASSSAKDVWSSVKSWWSNLSGDTSNIMNTMGNNISNIWGRFTNYMTSPIEKAKNLISGIIENIKGFFNINLSFPSIPLPHFDIYPRGWNIGDLMKGRIPSLGINWYAKGTKNHPGGMAIVNDAKSAQWQEAYKTPGGAWKMFPAIKEMLVDLPQGTQVMPAANISSLDNFSDSVLGGISSPMNDSSQSFKGFETLQLPELFNEKPVTYSNENVGGSKDVSSYGMTNMNDSLISAIMMLVQSLGAQANQATNGDIVINIGGREFGRIAVSEINKYHQQLGYTELNI